MEKNKVSRKKNNKIIKKKNTRVITEGIAHINATFNNTIVTISDKIGNVLTWSSAGAIGLKGSKKSTPYAAQIVAEAAGKASLELGMKTVEIKCKGPGSGRDAAVRSLQAVGLEITSIKEATPIPHNGCRPPKRPRG